MKVELDSHGKLGQDQYPTYRSSVGDKSTAASSSAEGMATKTPSGGDRRAPVSVVIIDDDEDEDDDDDDVVQARRTSNDAGSASSSPRNPVGPVDDEDEEEEDECRIVGTRRVRPSRRKVTRPRDQQLDVNDLTGLSDCEVEVATGSQADLRRQWEEAAVRRRVGRPAASKMSRVAQSSYAAQPTFKRSFFKRQGSAESVSTSASGADQNQKTKVETGASTQKTPEPEVESCRPGTNGTSAVDQETKVGTGASTQRTPEAEVESCRPGANGTSAGSEQSERTADKGKQAESVEHKQEKPPPSGAALKGVIFREEIKESAEYQKANEEEWARRQLELEKQAQEAQRLRKRKRAEAERRLAIENRQKQRVETMREEQQQEMKNSGVKEQIRAQVQVELESKASGCPDLATLLRRLGIEVQGGSLCTPSQVNTAYKKALFRFHPDRTSGNNDMAAQVRAEETFKLISRLKATLEPVATPNVVRRF